MVSLEILHEMHRAYMEKRLMLFMDLTASDLVPDPDATMELNVSIFDKPETAMAFSESIANVFKDTNTELKDDETFACIMCVVKKPTHISEAMDPIPLMSMMPVDSGGVSNWQTALLDPKRDRSIYYLMEPTIMQQVMKAREQDKIKY